MDSKLTVCYVYYTDTATVDSKHLLGRKDYRVLGNFDSISSFWVCLQFHEVIPVMFLIKFVI